MTFIFDNLTWRKIGIQAFIVGMVVVALIIAVAAIFNIYFNSPPLIVKALTQPPDRTICADETYEVLVEVTPKSTTLVSFYLVVRDHDNNHYVDRNQTPLFEIPTQEGITFVQRLPWKVPNLPPGQYIRILAMRGHDTDQVPLVFTEPFTIGECDEKSSTDDRGNQDRNSSRYRLDCIDGNLADDFRTTSSHHHT